MASDIGLVGLGVMGRSLALNMARNGFGVAAYNRTPKATEQLLAAAPDGYAIVGARSLEELVAAVRRPRAILLMVPAGAPVDEVVGELLPSLARGDIVVDGGNSHWRDTDRRRDELAGAGLHFVGMGVSGGEKGALEGPSLMPGGDAEAWRRLEPILTRIAARTDSGPCVAHLGPGGAGHFVKMVHNGIEYGLMQLIAETYDLLRHAAGLSTAELSRLFDDWNRGELESFLVEITAAAVDRPDDRGDGPLIDKILDSAGQKGTGKWTVQEALDLGVPTPTISAAVDARYVSALRRERLEVASRWDEGEWGDRGEVWAASPQRPIRPLDDDRADVVGAARAALYGSAICCYAQGFALLAAASSERRWGLDLREAARVWKGGCIIRAALLDDIMAAFERRPDLPNLLLDDELRGRVAARAAALRATLRRALDSGAAMPAYGATLAWIDSYRRERLPASLLQALRDYFGAHTYERIDREGSFHTDWEGEPSGR